jgi:hypothetical protein
MKFALLPVLLVLHNHDIVFFVILTIFCRVGLSLGILISLYFKINVFLLSVEALFIMHLFMSFVSRQKYSKWLNCYFFKYRLSWEALFNRFRVTYKWFVEHIKYAICKIKMISKSKFKLIKSSLYVTASLSINHSFHDKNVFQLKYLLLTFCICKDCTDCFTEYKFTSYIINMSLNYTKLFCLLLRR